MMTLLKVQVAIPSEASQKLDADSDLEQHDEQVTLSLPADAEVARKLRDMCIDAMWKPSGPGHYR